MKKINLKTIISFFANIGKGVQTTARTLQIFMSNMMVRKKKKKKKKKILSWFVMGHLFLFSFVFLYFEVLLRIFNGKGVFSHLIYPILFGISAGLLVNALTTLFNKKINRIISIVLMLVTAIFFITETLVKRTYQVYMTIPSMLQGANGVVGNYSSELINTIVGGLLVIFVFLLPVILYMLIGKKVLPAYQYKWPAAVLNVILSFAVFVVGVLCSSIGPSRMAYKGQYEFSNATETFGLLTSLRLSMTRSASDLTSVSGVNENDEWAGEDYSIYDKNVMNIDFDSLSKNAKKEEKEIDKYMESATPSSQNKFTGIFKGKNLILICAEAFHGAVIREDLTPTLYRMEHNGFYFSDFYQPTWGGSTSSGEFSFVTGLVPAFQVESMTRIKDNNNYFTMGNQMQRLGYYTAAYHNGDYDFYDRDQTHENLGYNTWIARNKGLDEITEEKYSDFMMIDKTLDIYLDQERPFSIYYMSMDGHAPYVPDSGISEANWDYVTSVIGNDYSDTITSYYCYQYNFELALENLVERLEAAGVADDTVVCICPDHYPYGLSEGSFTDVDVYSELLGQENENRLVQDKNSLIIWSESLEEGHELAPYQCEITTPTYSLDVLPTLSNLFGLEYDSRMLVGRDVFSDMVPLVCWLNYSWKSDKGYYEVWDNKFYPNEGVDVDQSYVDKMCKLAQNKVSLSQQIIETDYYKHLFGKDDVTDSTKIKLDPEIEKIIKKRKEE